MKITKKLIAALLGVSMLTGCAGNSTSAPTESTADTSAPEQTETTPAESVSSDSSEESAVTDESEVSEAPAESEAEQAEPIERDLDYEWDKVIALTFDDGPNTTTTYEVLEVLKKHGVVASFFLIGNNITDESAEAVKYAHDLGCEIDNHSKSHDYMNEMSAEDCEAECRYVDDKVFEITGEHTKFFRPPYLAIDFPMWDYIDVPFIAGIGCDDWNPKVDVDRRVAVVEKKAADGAIILMHDAEGNSQTVEAIDRIIPDLKAQGYKFVTVSELFEEKGITPAKEILYSNVEQTGTWS